ncbi:MAG: hypothetical protein AVDCRST_MAG66-948, partial [uncultured Pseudonocardia sp.]
DRLAHPGGSARHRHRDLSAERRRRSVGDRPAGGGARRHTRVHGPSTGVRPPVDGDHGAAHPRSWGRGGIPARAAVLHRV